MMDNKELDRRLCSIDGCDNNHDARGYCKKHYQRWSRHGHPLALVGKGKPPVHGMSGTLTHEIWKSMKQRCLNKKYVNYHRYGGRGISVCDKWLNFVGFYEDMGEKPRGMTLDRIDNNGNYCKENCRWATQKEQCNNRNNNVIINIHDIKLNITQWSELLGTERSLISRRIKAGWSPEQAVGFNWENIGKLIEEYHIEITLDRPHGAPKPKAGEGIWNGIINHEMDGFYWEHGKSAKIAAMKALVASMEGRG